MLLQVAQSRELTKSLLPVMYNSPLWLTWLKPRRHPNAAAACLKAGTELSTSLLGSHQKPGVYICISLPCVQMNAAFGVL